MMHVVARKTLICLKNLDTTIAIRQPFDNTPLLSGVPIGGQEPCVRITRAAQVFRAGREECALSPHAAAAGTSGNAKRGGLLGSGTAGTEAREIPGRVVIDLAFGIEIEGPILGDTHKRSTLMLRREELQLYFSIFPAHPRLHPHRAENKYVTKRKQGALAVRRHIFEAKRNRKDAQHLPGVDHDLLALDVKFARPPSRMWVICSLS
jgi:hypothetical protein